MEEVQRPGQPGQPGRPGGAQTGRDQREPGAEDEPVSMRELLEAEAGAVRDVGRGAVVEGTGVGIDPDEGVVDIGLKSEGVIPGREVTSIEEELGRPPRIGDTLLVYVVAPETAEGHALLSYRRAGTGGSWGRGRSRANPAEASK